METGVALTASPMKSAATASSTRQLVRSATTGIKINGDGCSADCKSYEKCGNGILNQGEICDDKNNIDGDGCSADCKSDEKCGNGIVDKTRNEVCDDGNQTNGDGCSADCRTFTVCGNGILDPREVCDDGNTQSGDWCSATANRWRSVATTSSTTQKARSAMTAIKWMATDAARSANRTRRAAMAPKTTSSMTRRGMKSVTTGTPRMEIIAARTACPMGSAVTES